MSYLFKIVNFIVLPTYLLLPIISCRDSFNYYTRSTLRSSYEERDISPHVALISEHGTRDRQ